MVGKSTVKLLDLIDLDFLQDFQDNFAYSVGVASLIEDEHGNALTRPSCFSELCMKIIRASEYGLRRCRQTEIRGAKEAARTGRPAVYQCHAGLIDFAAPIMLEGNLIGAIFGGQILTEAPNIEKCSRVAREIGVDPDEYVVAVRKLPIIPKEKIQSAANVLFSVANTISKIAYQTLKIRERNRELVLAYSRMENIVNTISDGVLIIDNQGTVEQVNTIAEEIFGKPGSVLINKPVRELFGSYAPCVEGVLERQRAYNDIEIFVDTSFGRLHCLSSGRPIFDERGVLSGGVISLRPIKRVQNLINRLSGAQATFRFSDIIGQSPAILKTIQMAQKAAGSMSNVLLEGESGSGKEIFAQAIHNHSPRRKGPFVAVNCGAIPRELIGSELFGYAEGAFTGAKKGGRPGKFELASGGTLFLDEIGEMPLEHQVSLLRVLQERKVTRLGDDKVIPVDVRIICATNKNLAQEVEKGNFRQDLFYRLNVISIKIPSLRERQEDIPLLFRYMLNTIGREWGKNIKHVDPEVMRLLNEYDWPGNVRELQNVVERIISIIDDDDIIRLEHLSDSIVQRHPSSGKTESLSEIKKIKRLLREEERQKIINLLVKFRGNVSLVAREMGLARSTIYRKMSQYDIY